MEDENAFQIADTMKKEKKNSASQEDWKDYAYGGKSLLDNTGKNNNIKQESSKTTRLEKKRNLVIGYVPPVESTKTGKLDNPEENNNIKQESSCEEGVS